MGMSWSSNRMAFVCTVIALIGFLVCRGTFQRCTTRSFSISFIYYLGTVPITISRNSLRRLLPLFISFPLLRGFSIPANYWLFLPLPCIFHGNDRCRSPPLGRRDRGRNSHFYIPAPCRRSPFGRLLDTGLTIRHFFQWFEVLRFRTQWNRWDESAFEEVFWIDVTLGRWKWERRDLRREARLG